MSSSSRRLSQVAAATGGVGIGQTVEVQGSHGVVRFSGTTDFASGRWFGIELEGPQGKNDGSVQGKRYFECAANHGVFVRMSQIKILGSSGVASAEGIPRPRATIHGAEIQQAEQPKLRPPSRGTMGGDALARTARRASALPPGSASGIATPSISRLSAPFGQRIAGSQLPGASPAGVRRSSGAQQQQQLAMRRSTLSGTSRSGSRQALSSGSSEVSASRPMSREQQPIHAGTGLHEAAAIVDDNDKGESEDEKAEEEAAPRTPYRPSLSMDEVPSIESPTSEAQTVSIKQYEELRVKYRFLEQKRSEDRQRLQNADKVQAEAEQALRVRNKLAARMAAQQNETRELKQQLKDSTAAREAMEAKYADSQEMMEMLSVDKEMAEERAETLAQETEALREQLAEANTDLDVLREGGAPGEPMEAAQLQRQNERLKEALVRLRDVTTESEGQLSLRVKQLEREAQAATELAEEGGALRERLAGAEAQIDDLKERLDDALGAEEMIEALTERNLELSRVNEEQQAALENMEALCEVNNEMDETRAEEVQGLRADIERLNATLRERDRRVDALEEAVVDYQFNISQYRDLVAALQADVQRLREREQTQASEAASISSHTQEMLSQNLQLRSSVMKTKAKAVDLELRRLDAEQAVERLTLTEPFLPDHFRSEGAALAALLALKRLAAKAEILCSQLEQPDAPETLSDSFVAAADVRALLARCSAHAALLVGFMSSCGDAEFLRLAALLHDAQPIERRLNGLIDLVRSEELRTVDALPEVRRLATQLCALTDAHVPAKAELPVPRLDAAAASLAFGVDVQLANLCYTEQLLVSTSVFTPEDRQRIESGVLGPLVSTINGCRDAKGAAVKLLRRARELHASGFVASSRAQEQAAQIQQAGDALGEYTMRVRVVVQDHLAAATAEEDAQPASLERLLQDLASITQDIFGANDASPLGLGLRASQQLAKQLAELLALLGDDREATKGPAIEAPWIRRAAQFKASLVQNTDVQRRTEALNEEIISLARELKLRDQTIQEHNVRAEMHEKRTDTMRKQSEHVAELKKLLDTARTKEHTYEEAIESLQSEMDSLEAEARKLRQANEAAAKAAAAGGFLSGSNGSGSPIPTDLLGLRNKIGTLQDSVAYLRKENAHLRAKYMYKEELALLRQTSLPVHTAANKEVGEVVREAKVVAREACRLAAMPKLVKLGAQDRHAAWQPLSSHPQFELYRQQTLAQTLKHRAERVQQRLRSIRQFPALATSGTSIVSAV
ncbi:hypothetical protein COEREDRAFT_7367 [Coemansia reversa NRRL 1564]|uniref:CAP-Gly domain-containing protein n=1 Tax=Coemansia reversa (strain ATCC 12441 / NRRL 1564) TaxID=763665 RepID=A0A2G5BEH8_COERN|nr:hypothetical protein COEREDRAFT_7367 [Coemansia reversa NRRL 1564]|eukprot:PIA17401.1 hypothetical protein COEREDRAFT_7367 [Coemansia reversa NRRL 1564]